MARRRNTNTDNALAVAYIRVSTAEQNLGPDAQLEQLNQWAKANGAKLVAVHVDHGVSGATELDKRAALLAALASIEAFGAGHLLVAKRDRLARDVVVAAVAERMVEQLGAVVTSADGAGNGTSPDDVFMKRIQDGLAERERAMIGVRTRAALAVKRQRGERIGRIPFGFRLAADGVHLEHDEAEQRVLGILRRYRAEGLTVRDVAKRLNDAGAATRSGRPWSKSAVSRMLNRKVAA